MEDKPSEQPLHPFLAESRQFAKVHKKLKIKPKVTKPFTPPDNTHPVNRDQRNRWWENFWD